MSNENQERIKIEDSLLYHQYIRAIDARDKLNENYDRWMTFYYVALGSILFAIITLIAAEKDSNFILLKIGLLILATFVSLVWHLSCKGYNYWSNSWIIIIKRLELNIIKNNRDLAVYTDFSKTIIESEKKSFYPLKSGNISTPKITLGVSFCATVLWAILSVFVYSQFEKSICCRTLSTILWVLILIFCYWFPLYTKYFESRKSDFDATKPEEFQQN